MKRQAMSELQKAVSEAERKAHEMISSERAKMERTVAEAKRQAAEDALSIINQQEDSSEVGAGTVASPEHQPQRTTVSRNFSHNMILLRSCNKLRIAIRIAIKAKSCDLLCCSIFNNQ